MGVCGCLRVCGCVGSCGCAGMWSGGPRKAEPCNVELVKNPPMIYYLLVWFLDLTIEFEQEFKISARYTTHAMIEMTKNMSRS